MHLVYERPDQWHVLSISKIFALGIPKPQPEENKLETKNSLGVRSIASEIYQTELFEAFVRNSSNCLCTDLFIQQTFAELLLQRKEVDEMQEW